MLIIRLPRNIAVCSLNGCVFGQAGKLTLNFSPHNINEALESAALLCYDMAASKGLELSWFVDPSLPPSLIIDATRLQQVLLNTLSNAIKVSGLCEFVGRTAAHRRPGSGCRSSFLTLSLCCTCRGRVRVRVGVCVCARSI